MNYPVKVWYAPYKLIPAIGILGLTIHERELLRVIIDRYCALYFKKRTHHKVEVTLTPEDVEGFIGRSYYFTALRRLSDRGIVQVRRERGRKATQNISVITEKMVNAVKANNRSTKDLLECDTIGFL